MPEVPMIRYFGFANSDAVLINSLQGYKEVLHTNCYSFVRTTAFRRLIQDIIGVGLVFAEGDEHRRQRRALGGMTFLISQSIQASGRSPHRALTQLRVIHRLKCQELPANVQREGCWPGCGV